MASFKIGDQVSFKPGGRSISPVTAKVVRIEGQFLVTDDGTKERKIRPGACTAA